MAPPSYTRPMTPTANQLKHRIEQRLLWFHNEWFFKWHHIGGAHTVKIDTFDGRHASYSGLGFSGSPRNVFWNSITRGTRKEIVEQFAWVDSEVRRYNEETAQKAIDECTGLLISFAGSIRRTAIEKDRILRGDGINFPPELDSGRWDGTLPSDIEEQGRALKAALPKSAPAVERPLTRRARLNSLWHENQWWMGPVGWVVGLVGLAALFV